MVLHPPQKLQFAPILAQCKSYVKYIPTGKEAKTGTLQVISREDGGIPIKTDYISTRRWIPACAGMTPLVFCIFPAN